jgi:hypothetical protein
MAANRKPAEAFHDKLYHSPLAFGRPSLSCRKSAGAQGGWDYDGADAKAGNSCRAFPPGSTTEEPPNLPYRAHTIVDSRGMLDLPIIERCEPASYRSWLRGPGQSPRYLTDPQLNSSPTTTAQDVACQAQGAYSEQSVSRGLRHGVDQENVLPDLRKSE